MTSQEGRKLFLATSLTEADGSVLATSSAVFVTVGADHFAQGMQ